MPIRVCGRKGCRHFGLSVQDSEHLWSLLLLRIVGPYLVRERPVVPKGIEHDRIGRNTADTCHR